MQSRRSFLIGVILCIVTVALFTYQYINTTTYYLIIVDGLVFLSFLVLLYSKAVYVGEETTTSRATVESNVLRWPNVGKF
jgi:VIT1/CCC1 family predicted Fe2+/Mn2+ transporter